jgi:hypothetical protein
MKLDGRTLSLLLSSLLLFGCQEGTEQAQEVVEAAQRTHGVRNLEGDTVRFDFRKHRYLHYREPNGSFFYQRRPVRKEDAQYRDVLSNEGFTRYRKGKAVELSAEDSSAYAASLNSVVYFAFLPYRLNDRAVIKSYEGKEKVGDSSYHRVRITFRKEGGGEDHEDVFMYWFREKDHRMDFFAYRYYRDGGGVRFREAYDRKRTDGLLVQDYRNFKAPMDTELAKLDELWQKDRLEQVSKIETENLKFR